MGCCLSQPEIDSQENTSRTAIDPITITPAVSPPQYIERNDYVVESGKSMEPIQGESSTDPVQDEKTKHHSSIHINEHSDLSHNNSSTMSTDHSQTLTKDTPMTMTTTTIENKEMNESTMDDTSNGWPIIIRSSMAGKDITIHLPITSYWTLHELRQYLEPQLQQTALATASSSSSSSSSNNFTLRIRFIYLGKILPESTTLIPLAHHNNDTPTDSIILDKYGVIQAMVSKVN